MCEHIAVAVPVQAAFVGDGHATNHKRASLDERVDVVSNADSHESSALTIARSSVEGTLMFRAEPS